MALILLAFLIILLGLLIWVLSIRRPVAASFKTFSLGENKQAVDSVRVGTYNIHRARGTDGKKDVKRIAGVLEKTDIVGLNEVEGSVYGVVVDQASMLGSELNMVSEFYPTQSRWLREDRGNGLLSKYPIRHLYNEPLVDSTGRRNRILSTAQVLIGTESVEVMTTHLSRRVDQEIQLEIILKRFCSYDKAILLGDFNISRKFPSLAVFLQSDFAVDAIAVGLGDEDSAARIDWILTRGLSVRDAGFEPVGASDHPNYWVDLTLEL